MEIESRTFSPNRGIVNALNHLLFGQLNFLNIHSPQKFESVKQDSIVDNFSFYSPNTNFYLYFIVEFHVRKTVCD